MIAANTPAFLFDVEKLAADLKVKQFVTGFRPESIYESSEIELKKYQKVRDDIFASVIKGQCVNCGANLPIKEVNKFRFGETIICDSCDFTLSPTLFGASHV